MHVFKISSDLTNKPDGMAKLTILETWGTLQIFSSRIENE
jgi:hypothetical protein